MKAFSLGLLLLLSSCKSPLGILASARPATAQAKIVQPSGATIDQRGSAEVPAKQSATASVAEIPLAKGSRVTVVPPSAISPGSISLILSENSALKLTSHSESASMPQTFRPPSPPSATDLAKADGLKLYFWVSVGLALLGGFLIYAEHVKAGVIAIIGAIGVPIMGRFVSESSALTLALVATVGATAIFGAWYLIRHRLAPQTGSPQTAPVAAASHS